MTRASSSGDRNPTAYAPLSLVEGVHAAMFNSTAEFEAKVRYYLAHEKSESASCVMPVPRRRTHEWRRRGADLVELISAALPEYRKAAPERKNPVTCHVRWS